MPTLRDRLVRLASTRPAGDPLRDRLLLVLRSATSPRTGASDKVALRVREMTRLLD